jgi:hypothetical protein
MVKTKRVKKTKSYRKTKRVKKTKGCRKTKRRLRLKRTQKGGNESTETILTDAKNLTESQFQKKYKIIHTAEKQDFDNLKNIFNKKYKLDPDLSPNKENYPKIYRDVEMIENIMKEDEVKTDDYIINLYYILSLMTTVLIGEFIKIGVIKIKENGEIDINERNKIIRAIHSKLTKYLEDLMTKIKEIMKRQKPLEEEAPLEQLEEEPLVEAPLEEGPTLEEFNEKYGDE